ncbi:MAG: hypothetical protein EON48_04150 [Acetobacteraceae bacterium]|nr:MAG: hypothetical protein EON48_04150 [Acetobacteraceae bacterium]
MTPSTLPDRQERDTYGRPTSRLRIVAGAVLGVGAVALVAFMAEQRAVAQRPKDSAPSRTRKLGLADAMAASTAVTVALPLTEVQDAIARERPEEGGGQSLAHALLGDDKAGFQPIEHQGDDVISWRTEDGGTLVKLILRPVRGDRMTSVTAIVAREEGSSLRLPLFGATQRTRLKQALTRFRMQLETGETAQAR